MRISISSTNPCHLWPLARELAQVDALGAYYSGYPAWKLGDGAKAVNTRVHSVRTNIVYGLLKLPPSFRPPSRALFRWQDWGFDRWVGNHLDMADFIHAMPGQALQTFRAAKRLGLKTVLNHATGPVRDWVKIMDPEYQRAGLRMSDHTPYDDSYFEREDEEYELADFHCAASSVVRDQLLALGIAENRVWVVPYGADSRVFHPCDSTPQNFRILFAGQICLRKGMRTFLEALTLAGRDDWGVDFVGGNSGETARIFADYRGATPLRFHGTQPQPVLARMMRESSVLVLPSLEEGFGLVVPQALSCGTPCIVSDRVGARDLIRHRENGSVFPAFDPEALVAELNWWNHHPARLHETFGWTEPARRLIALSTAAS